MKSSLGYTIVWFGPLKVTVPLFGELKILFYQRCTEQGEQVFSRRWKVYHEHSGWG